MNQEGKRRKESRGVRERRGEGKEKGSGGVISIDEITLTNTTVSGNLR